MMVSGNIFYASDKAVFDALTQNLDLNPPVKNKKNNYKNK